MRSMSLLLATGALAACSTAPEVRSPRAEAHLQQMLAGKVAQQSVDCLPTFRSTDMVVIDDGTILFRDGRKVYRNDLNGGSCSGLGGGHYALITTQHGRLCRGDIGEVKDLTNGVTVGSCVMGDFVPYVPAAG